MKNKEMLWKNNNIKIINISQALNIELSEFDNLCTYFTDELKNPNNWTYPVTNFGIDEVEMLHKKYTLWKNIKKEYRNHLIIVQICMMKTP